MHMGQYITHYHSPLGILTLAGDGQSITGLWLEGQKYFGATLPAQTREKEVPIFAQARAWLDLYFSGKQPDFMPRLAPGGSAFRQAVWAALRRIPYGAVTTYGQIARQLAQEGGGPVCAQAVGGAVGHNPISIFIPCHRVVGATGSLTGYAGGLEKKIWLLKKEGAWNERLFLPHKGSAL